MLFEIGEVSFHLIGTNDFHEKPGNERFLYFCGLALYLKISRCLLTGYVKEFSTIIFLHSTNQVSDVNGNDNDNAASQKRDWLND